MTEYHKIDSVFKRDQRGNFLIGEWSRPEFEYLQDNPWIWTEKIDGTNIRIMWGDGRPIRYGGRTDNAQIPAKLINALNDLFQPYYIQVDKAGGKVPYPSEYERIHEGDYGEKRFGAIFKGAEDVVLYGEGYGAGIQKGGGNYSPDQKFILFDVRVGNWWLKREDVLDIASKLSLVVVPQVEGCDSMELNEMIEWVRYAMEPDVLDIPDSALGTAKVEGWVGTPEVPLFARNGDRIITKVKYKDFKNG